MAVLRTLVPLRGRGETTGDVREWHPRKGWHKVAGTELSGPNGIAVSPDGKWLFVNAWGGMTVNRFSCGTATAQRAVLPMGYHMDNLRWEPDGSLLAIGHNNDKTKIVRINPATLGYETVFERADTERFERGTVAVRIDDEIWIGSARSKVISVIPAARR